VLGYASHSTLKLILRRYRGIVENAKCTCIGAGRNANISFAPLLASPEYPSKFIKTCIPSSCIISAASRALEISRKTKRLS